MKTQKKIKIRDIEKPNFVVTTRALIEHPKKKGIYLILRRSLNDRKNKGMWELPGGKTDFMETPDRAIIREVKEETGLHIEIAKEQETLDYELIRDGKYKDHIHIAIYYPSIILNGSADKIKISDEHIDFNWKTFKEILKMNTTARTKKFIKKISHNR